MLSKDTKGLVSASNKFKVNLSLVKTVIKSNENRVNLLIQENPQNPRKKLKNKRIAFLGVTFKPNTDDMRLFKPEDDSYLSKKGAKLSYYDPSGEKNNLKRLKIVHIKQI